MGSIMSNHEVEEVEVEDSNELDNSTDDHNSHNLVVTAIQYEDIANDANDIHENDNELHADSHGDHLDGGVGDDDIFGDIGDDVLIAGLGNDHLDGGDGDDSLFGDDGDDVLRAGFGNDVLTGGAGLDDFTFYAGGDFKVTDYNTSDDSLVFDSATTGLHDLNELLRVITNISDTTEGVVIEFGQVATITLVGLTIADLNAGMVHFS